MADYFKVYSIKMFFYNYSKVNFEWIIFNINVI